MKDFLLKTANSLLLMFVLSAIIGPVLAFLWNQSFVNFLTFAEPMHFLDGMIALFFVQILGFYLMARVETRVVPLQTIYVPITPEEQEAMQDAQRADEAADNSEE